MHRYIRRTHSTLLSVSAIIVLVIGSATYSRAQVDCENLLRSVYRRFIALTSHPHSEKIFRIDYTLRTTMRNVQVGSSETRMEIVSTASHLRCRSKEVEIYQDKLHTVTVMPGKKTIRVQDNIAGEDAARKMKNFALLQDSVLALCTVQSCRDIPYNGGKAKEVTLVVKKEAKRIIPITAVTYLIDVQQQSLHRIRLQYAPSSPFAEVDMTIHAFEEDYRDDSFGKPVISQFLVDGRLPARYSDYKLIDLRNNSNTTVNKRRKK